MSGEAFKHAPLVVLGVVWHDEGIAAPWQQPVQFIEFAGGLPDVEHAFEHGVELLVGDIVLNLDVLLEQERRVLPMEKQVQAAPGM